MKPAAPAPAQRLTVLSAVAIALLYARSMTTLPFADDWNHIERAQRYGFRVWFPEQFFRPFERLVNAVNSSVFDIAGPITLACNIGVLLATAWVIHRLARRLAPGDAL